jgi:hypothetical protein
LSSPAQDQHDAARQALAEQHAGEVRRLQEALEAARLDLQAYVPNIADLELLNEVSQIVLKIDFLFVIRTTPFQFVVKITPDSCFVRSVWFGRRIATVGTVSGSPRLTRDASRPRPGLSVATSPWTASIAAQRDAPRRGGLTLASPARPPPFLGLQRILT